MSENNADDIFADEEGEIVNEEESKEDEEDQDWGGDTNEIIMPDMTAITALITLHTLPQPVLPERRIRRRQEVNQQHPNKMFRSLSGKRIARERTPSCSYLCLKSGEEFYFNDDDGKNILLNEHIESNKLIRNIISRIPVRVRERLEFLAKFESDEESEDEENGEKVQRRYFGNLKELVYEAYIKEWRLRYLFKKIIIHWRVWKMNKTSERELDPITLSEPEKEVYIYDWDNKKKFLFDAKSLATMIESKLMYHEYGFPVPMYPRNPKNNVELSYKQLISIYNQLKNYGELRWGFTTLREFNFNKNRWHIYHKSALIMNAIKGSIALLDSFEARELFLDFIFAKMDEVNFRYNNGLYDVYQAAMVRLPNHWYLEKLKGLAVSHYEATHFGQNRTRIINTACVRIFKFQSRFLADLKNKRIIN
jgi:hypothetical protein